MNSNIFGQEELIQNIGDSIEVRLCNKSFIAGIENEIYVNKGIDKIELSGIEEESFYKSDSALYFVPKTRDSLCLKNRESGEVKCFVSKIYVFPEFYLYIDTTVFDIKNTELSISNKKNITFNLKKEKSKHQCYFKEYLYVENIVLFHMRKNKVLEKINGDVKTIFKSRLKNNDVILILYKLNQGGDLIYRFVCKR